MFDADFSDELKFIIRKLIKKDKKKAEIIHKKVKEIINNDSMTIERYKNLRGNMKEYKRVYINTSFVLTFKVDVEKNLILFDDFDHHDRIYKK